jgi:hypothetical protein
MKHLKTRDQMLITLMPLNIIRAKPNCLSSYKLSEIYIIDHSTSSKEAAGHIGGRWGKGGDFLYRWGNPQNYRRGDSTNRKLFHQHDIKWIEKGYLEQVIFCSTIMTYITGTV